MAPTHFLARRLGVKCLGIIYHNNDTSICSGPPFKYRHVFRVADNITRGRYPTEISSSYTTSIKPNLPHSDFKLPSTFLDPLIMMKRAESAAWVK